MFMFIYRQSNDQSNNRSNKSNNQTHIIMFLYRQSNTVGNFLLSIGVPLYVPIYRLYILWSSMDNRKLPFVNSVCSHQRFALVLYDISHPGVHQSPHPLWSLCPLCSFTIATNGRSHRMLYFSIQTKEQCSKSTMSILSILSILSIVCNAKVSEKVFFFNHLVFS